MTRYSFTLAQVKRIAKKAGFSGEWQQEVNGRWTLHTNKVAGLEWSPTWSQLRFFGPTDRREQLMSAVTEVLKRTLIAGGRRRGSDRGGLRTRGALSSRHVCTVVACPRHRQQFRRHDQPLPDPTA